MRSTARRKDKQLLDVDGRGRITLPVELRDGIDAFRVEQLEDGSLKLVPQKVVSLEEAKLIRMLKRSISDFKAGRVEKIPEEWLDKHDS